MVHRIRCCDRNWGPLQAVYGCGILAGSLASSICDPATNLIGASGADYALVGAWVAYTFINWDTMDKAHKYWIAIIQFLFVACGNFDFVFGPSLTSFAAMCHPYTRRVMPST